MTSPDGRLGGNAFLVGAVSLPLVVVGFFLLSTVIPRWTVPPPRYDVLLHTRSWEQSGPRVTVDFTVEEGRLMATVRPLAANTISSRSTLWLFDRATMSVREVPVELPEQLAEGEAARALRIEALAGRRVLAQAEAPDGYEVRTRSTSSPGLIGDVFGMRRNDRTVTVAHRGRVVRIEVPSRQRQADPEFLGWVIDE